MPPSLSAFISYSRRNGYLAAQLWRDLRRAGIGVWMDASGIALESQWRDEIRSAIEGCDVVLLLASPEAASHIENRAIRAVTEHTVSGETPRISNAIRPAPASSVLMRTGTNP